MSQSIVPYQDDRQLGDMIRVAEMCAKSGFFTDSRDAAQAVVKILAGRELGFGPVASMTGVYIVKGRVTLSANLISAAIKRSGRYNYRVDALTDTECRITFTENGQVVGVSAFTLQDAKRAGLGGENWSKYPRNMLFARAISNGAKWHCPDVFGGPVYTPDEIETVDAAPIVEPPAPEPALPEPPIDEVAELAAVVPGAVASEPVPAPSGNGKEPPQGTVPRTGRRTAVVQTPAWRDRATALAAEIPYYQDGEGRASYYHMLGAVAKCGYDTVTPANLGDVLAALRKYASENA